MRTNIMKLINKGVKMSSKPKIIFANLQALLPTEWVDLSVFQSKSGN